MVVRTKLAQIQSSKMLAGDSAISAFAERTPAKFPTEKFPISGIIPDNTLYYLHMKHTRVLMHMQYANGCD